MATRMLIDATHDEETRVVIVKGTRLEEFDYETASKKQLKGNIYLAKVTRVEPSLQAAFVEYGGNRHGFLPFSEIHPDYYQVPVSDREGLLQEETVAEKEALEKEEAEVVSSSDSEKNGGDAAADKTATKNTASDDEEGVVDDEGDTLGGLETVGEDEDDSVENLGGDDEAEPGHKATVKRHYKIQEVIKRRQILLVQVVKEERGNKGAALTTYISLPGRYSVLMPNTGRGGGISRKISNPADRKRLKKIATELEVPEGIGVIIRTAGLNRTKVEIRRDYEFLMRMWDDIRSLTLKSMAPSCVYEEANLIKRTIRDLYSKDVSEILIEGDEGYRIAKDFMRKLMPSHAKKVQPYRDRIPLFHRFQVEQQFASMYHPEVHLKSGGYIVINPTEALVSIDVNSGKATKERSIEETAVKTNLEAAEELARQLRLRDLAGLIVIDFIDMDDNRNNKAVERRMKDCLKSDRARIQVGRISPFGLMEMSRQRLRPSFLETSTNVCHTCGGSGFVRSIESTALLIIRALEEEGVRERSAKITVTAHTDVAIYLLNQKRTVIQELEGLYGLTILILADPTTNLNDHAIDCERGKGPDLPAATATAIAIAPVDEEEQDASTEESTDKESNSAKRRRRRRRRKDRDDTGEEVEVSETAEQTPVSEEDGAEEEPRKRRRGKRGGRRRSRPAGSEQPNDAPSENTDVADIEPEIVIIPIATADGEPAEDVMTEVVATDAIIDDVKEEAPKKPRRRRTRKPAASKTSEEKPSEENEGAEKPSEPEEKKNTSEEDKSEDAPEKVRPRRRRAPRKKVEKPAETPVEEKVAAVVANAEDAKVAPKVEPKPVEPVIVDVAPASEPPVSVEAAVVSEPAEEKKPKKSRRTGWWSKK